MGYPAATGPGASLTDATRARDLAPTAFWRRNCSRRSTGMVGLFISARRARRSGGKGRQGGAAGSQKHGAVCADRLAKKRTARASGVFIDALNLPPITRESPLRQSVDRKKPAVGLSRPQISGLRGWGATLLSSRVE